MIAVAWWRVVKLGCVGFQGMLLNVDILVKRKHDLKPETTRVKEDETRTRENKTEKKMTIVGGINLFWKWALVT